MKDNLNLMHTLKLLFQSNCVKSQHGAITWKTYSKNIFIKIYKKKATNCNILN